VEQVEGSSRLHRLYSHIKESVIPGVCPSGELYGTLLQTSGAGGAGAALAVERQTTAIADRVSWSCIVWEFIWTDFFYSLYWEMNARSVMGEMNASMEKCHGFLDNGN
jgi:hypothetical protein